jgi:hypothetical protein
MPDPDPLPSSGFDVVVTDPRVVVSSSVGGAVASGIQLPPVFGVILLKG